MQLVCGRAVPVFALHKQYSYLNRVDSEIGTSIPSSKVESVSAVRKTLFYVFDTWHRAPSMHHLL